MHTILQSLKIFLAKNLSLLRKRKAVIITVIKNPNRKRRDSVTTAMN